MFYNIANGAEYTNCPTDIDIYKGLQWDRNEDKSILKAFGYRKLVFPNPPPEGSVVTGTTYMEIDEDTYEKTQTWITAEQAETDRIESLAIMYGQQVGQLRTLLATFGVSMPTNKDIVASVCYSAVKSNATLSADSQLLMLVYDELSQHITDDDIYKISQII